MAWTLKEQPLCALSPADLLVTIKTLLAFVFRNRIAISLAEQTIRSGREPTNKRSNMFDREIKYLIDSVSPLFLIGLSRRRSARVHLRKRSRRTCTFEDKFRLEFFLFVRRGLIRPCFVRHTSKSSVDGSNFSLDCSVLYVFRRFLPHYATFNAENLSACVEIVGR